MVTSATDRHTKDEKEADGGGSVTLIDRHVTLPFLGIYVTIIKKNTKKNFFFIAVESFLGITKRKDVRQGFYLDD